MESPGRFLVAIIILRLCSEKTDRINTPKRADMRSSTNSPQSTNRRILMTTALVMAGLCGQAQAESFWANNLLIDLYEGSNRSVLARDLRRGGFELSDGTPLSFRNWYTPRYPELTMLFLRPLSESFGLIWGLGSGERAEKYEIDPSLHLGFIFQHQPFENAFLTIRLTYPIGGRLREKACVADYGDIGGIQSVNCRLAATLLPPEETLQYLVNESGNLDARLSINFSVRF
jgi:hypothetical protein